MNRIRGLFALMFIGSVSCTTDFGPVGQYLPCGSNSDCAGGLICLTAPKLGRVCVSNEQRAMLCAGPEVCNGIDDDCDERVDEELTDCCMSETVRSCAGTPPAPGCTGTETCDARGRWGRCVWLTVTGTICGNGGSTIDGDCREGDSESPWATVLAQSCVVGVGACARTGQYTCAPDARSVLCDVVSGASLTEVCNGVDDDCNGIIDDLPPIIEGFETPPCKPRIAICVNSRIVDVQTRDDGRVETCNGVDDDCSGIADDPWRAQLGQSCVLGVGACERTGVWQCAPDGAGVTCSASPGRPSPERCPELDMVDNDCDGETDEWQRDMIALHDVVFTMGSATGASEERPEHQVTLPAFCMDRTEVTNGQYRECARVGFCPEPVAATSRTRSSYYGDGQFDAYPVLNVRWIDAHAYCQWVGKRLPTEAEWEFAARGGDGRMYPWGNTAPTCALAHFTSCASDTGPVGLLTAGESPYGLRDMSGNVAEWVADWFDATYYAASPGASPRGPATGTLKVHRGGSFASAASAIGVTLRGTMLPTDAATTLGFRCAQ